MLLGLGTRDFKVRLAGMSNVGPVATCPGAAGDNLLGVFIYTVMPTAFRVVSRRYRIKSAEIDSRRVTDKEVALHEYIDSFNCLEVDYCPKNEGDGGDCVDRSLHPGSRPRRSQRRSSGVSNIFVQRS